MLHHWHHVSGSDSVTEEIERSLSRVEDAISKGIAFANDECDAGTHYTRPPSTNHTGVIFLEHFELEA